MLPAHPAPDNAESQFLRGVTAQVSGRAGDTQIAGARTVQTLNLGGSATTVVSLVVGV